MEREKKKKEIGAALWQSRAHKFASNYKTEKEKESEIFYCKYFDYVRDTDFRCEDEAVEDNFIKSLSKVR